MFGKTKKSSVDYELVLKAVATVGALALGAKALNTSERTESRRFETMQEVHRLDGEAAAAAAAHNVEYKPTRVDYHPSLTGRLLGALGDLL